MRCSRARFSIERSVFPSAWPGAAARARLHWHQLLCAAGDCLAAAGIGLIFGREYKHAESVDARRFSSLGWELYPDGLRAILERFSTYGVPMIVTENGIATTDETLRGDFIVAHLRALEEALQAGVDVRGYLYWTLFDISSGRKGSAPISVSRRWNPGRLRALQGRRPLYSNPSAEAAKSSAAMRPVEGGRASLAAPIRAPQGAQWDPKRADTSTGHRNGSAGRNGRQTGLLTASNKVEGMNRNSLAKVGAASHVSCIDRRVAAASTEGRRLPTASSPISASIGSRVCAPCSAHGRHASWRAAERRRRKCFSSCRATCTFNISAPWGRAMMSRHYGWKGLAAQCAPRDRLSGGVSGGGRSFCRGACD